MENEEEKQKEKVNEKEIEINEDFKLEKILDNNIEHKYSKSLTFFIKKY